MNKIEGENSFDSDWKQAQPEIFWGEIAPSDHVVQIYDSEEVILNSLSKFVISGLKAGDGVIIIAHPLRLERLNNNSLTWRS